MAGITKDDVVVTPSRPDQDTTGPVAVLLHGRGSNRHDLAQLAPAFPEGWTIVTPEAPHPGMPWGYGPGSAWYRYIEEDRVVGETLVHSLEALDGLLDQLPEIVDGTPSVVVLGGFSQGGTSSLAYAFTRPGRVAAALNFSGFLVDDPAVELEPDAVGRTPIFWGHGTGDPAIPFALAERGRATLHGLDADLTTRDYAMGHSISPEELRDAVAWITRRVEPSPHSR
ncbi:MAG TPA: alpha/beta hydrolase-fold protein [Longimicrobiales bacterium]|nr:alpha/beta hydrolase-fold protein [Longimicrobiales bacterium]